MRWNELAFDAPSCRSERTGLPFLVITLRARLDIVLRWLWMRHHSATTAATVLAAFLRSR